MHEDALETVRQDGLLKNVAAAVLAKWPSATSLSAEELKSRFQSRRLLAGWRLPASMLGIEQSLLLLLPELFPYALPQVSLEQCPAPAEYPHVELDGVFCLVGVDSFVALPADFRHVVYVVEEAVRVLSQGVSGANKNDFLDEVATYWSLGERPGKPIWLTVDDIKTTRALLAIEADGAVLIGDEEERAKRWLNVAQPRGHGGRVARAALIYLPEPIFPRSYPHDTARLASLASTAGEQAMAIVGRALEPGEKCYILFSFEHAGEMHVVGTTVDIGLSASRGKKSAPPLWQGYRKGKVPIEVLLQRVIAQQFPVVRATVVSVTGAALLKRTSGEPARRLASVRVAVIGVGALGATVARLLAQAGVRHLTLFDGEDFTWQNVGRHELTAKHVGRPKVAAIRDELLARFPDLDVRAMPIQWQHEWKKDPSAFDKYDLVVSATGEWTGEILLNSISRSSVQVPPVIFGWVEPHAIAGHAIAVLPTGGCLQCVCDAYGRFDLRVADVPAEAALQRENSCGAFFQPFSAAQAIPTAAMVTKMALDALAGRVGASERRTWVGAKEDFDAVGASITPTIWFQTLQADGFERVYRAPVHPQENCPCCGAEK